jgi:methylmalonyl-CoA mutase
MTHLSLAADFPAATREQWLALVEGVLKGADFERKLVARTHDGLRIAPLYPKAEGKADEKAEGVVRRAEPGRWRVAQRVDHPEPAKANDLALADLDGGADGLVLVARTAPAARGFGVGLDTLADLDRALQGVMLDLVHLRLDAGGHGRQAAALLVALAERRGHRLADLSLDLALDPVGAMAAMGLLSASFDVVAARCADTLADLLARGFSGRAFLADSRPYHEAGASEAQELAAVLATGLAYLRALESGGHGLEAARDALAFLLVADADEFLTVAKLRALRRLWARVEAACGLDPKPIRLHAETAWRMTTRRDPWVNLLRTTVATFSAGIGGADTIAVLPFTAALGLPDAFARRMARNTQLILLEESNLWRVADPAAGAGGFEALTDALCESAWALFQDIEREGGIVASLAAGAVQQRIATVRAARQAAVATRKDPITGTSEFPNLREAPVAVLLAAPTARTPASPPPASPGATPVAPFSSLVEAALAGATLQALAATAPGAAPVAVAPLPSTRSAAPFERLREASDEHLARTGERPKVFLAALGPLAAYAARAGFAQTFFEAGGIEAVLGAGGTDLDGLADAYRQSGAVLACLCSSDDIYREQAVAAASRLKQAGCRSLALAGRPGALEAALKDAGVETFVFMGCDAIAVLSAALRVAV